MIDFSLFIFSSLAFIISPGPDFIFVLKCGLSEGMKSGIQAAIGVSLGLFTHTISVAIGLSAVLSSSVYFMEAIKYIGSAYLVFLGVSFIRHLPASGIIIENSHSFVTPLKIGYLTNVSNPKALLLFFSFLPQFVDVGSAEAWPNFLILGTIVSTIGLIWFSLIGILSSRVKTIIKKRNRLVKGLSVALGVLMIVIGLKLFLDN